MRRPPVPTPPRPSSSSRALQLLLLATAACFAWSQAAAQQRVDLRKLDAYIAQARADWQVPGMAVAIVQDGKVVFERGYGVRHVTDGGPVDAHTLFAIASNTKAFTAASLAMLVDEGTIAWDTPVTDLLPYFQLYDPYVTREMRVRDLLSHRSGLGTYSGDLLWYGTGYSAADVVRRARYLAPARGFREGYGYSNLMFIAAGEIIPAVTGLRWDAFVTARILAPLGMSETVTSVSQLAGHANVATPHAEKDGRVVPVLWYPWDAMGSAGGIISSAHDMARWLILQLGRGAVNGTRLFSEEQSRRMWTPHTPIPVGATTEKRFPSTHFQSYGLGWSLRDYLGRKIVLHGGAYDGMFSQVVLVPEEQLGLVILTNATTSLQSALWYTIVDAYLGAPDADWSRDFLARARQERRTEVTTWEEWTRNRVVGTTPSRPLADYAGTYGGPMYGDVTVTQENGGLVVRFLPAPAFVGDLTHWHYDVFRIHWRHAFPWFGDGLVQFRLDDQGDVTDMRIDVPNDDFWFTELALKRRAAP